MLKTLQDLPTLETEEQKQHRDKWMTRREQQELKERKIRRKDKEFLNQHLLLTEEYAQKTNK